MGPHTGLVHEGVTIVQDQRHRESGLSCRLTLASMRLVGPRHLDHVTDAQRPLIKKMMRLIQHLALTLLLLPLSHAGRAGGQPTGAAGTNQRFEHSHDMVQNRRPTTIALPTPTHPSQSHSNLSART
jgi:hypothetical protein